MEIHKELVSIHSFSPETPTTIAGSLQMNVDFSQGWSGCAIAGKGMEAWVSRSRHFVAGFWRFQ